MIGEPMILAIGEILYDIFPEYKQLGGAPFNFAYHIAAFGQPVNFISRIGDDRNGSEIQDFLRQRNFDARGIQIDTTHRTGDVLIDISKPDDPQYEIVKDRAYDHISITPEIETLLRGHITLFYFGSLVQRSDQSRKTVRHILELLPPGTKKLYDINLRKECYTKEIITQSLQYCNILKINYEETRTVKSLMNYTGTDKSFLSSLIAAFSLDMICVTRGAEGSAVYTDDNTYSVEAPKVKTIDSVGAGDGYTAILAVGLLAGWSIPTILERATEFAKDICLIKGAVPDTTSFYDTYKHWGINA